MSKEDKTPSRADVLAMLARMHQTAADSEAAAGRHGPGAAQDQLAAKYRDAAAEAEDDEEGDK